MARHSTPKIMPRIAALLGFALLCASNSNAGTQVGHQRFAPARKIASLSSQKSRQLIPQGQGEEMLHDVRDARPSFLRQSPGRSPAGLSGKNGNLRIAGVCKDSYGVNHLDGNRDYENCIDSATRNTSTSVNNDFGPGQRQTGVGVLFQR